MTLIVGVRYLIASGGFAFATRLRHPGLYRGLDAQMRREVGWSLASAAIYGVPAGIVAWGWRHRGWTLIYTDLHARPLWYLPLSVLLYLLAHDAWFYWTHRWMHRPGPFRLAHAVHHASRPPTAWAAMAFHPVEALTGAVAVPLLVFAIPIHVGALGLVLAVMTVMGVTNHMGWEVFPGSYGAGQWGIGSSPRAITSGITSSTGVTMVSISVTGTGCAAPTGGWATSSGRTRALLAAGLASLPVLLGGAAPVSRLDVALDHLRSTRGLVRVCLTADPANFPACVDDADAVTLSLPAARQRFSLPNLTPGAYALAVIHDENGNGRLDTFAGIPREGYGFSRNAPVRFGPPRFAAARFEVAGAVTVEEIRMRYIF